MSDLLLGKQTHVFVPKASMAVANPNSTAFFNKFEYLFDMFVNQGFQTLEELYYKTWLHGGQRVIIQETNDNQIIKNVVTIQVLGEESDCSCHKIYGLFVCFADKFGIV